MEPVMGGFLTQPPSTLSFSLYLSRLEVILKISLLTRVNLPID
jgi:hypothetical protein